MNGCKSLLNSDGTEASDGEIACYEAAYSSTGTSGVVSSVVNSCQGSHSCMFLAKPAYAPWGAGDAGDVGDIKDSCLGYLSCQNLAFSYTANGGSIGDITNSCHGIESCAHISAGGSQDSGNVGDITCSCQGYRSCYYLYSDYYYVSPHWVQNYWRGVLDMLRVYLIVAMEQRSVRISQVALLYLILVLPMIILMLPHLPVQQHVVKTSMCRVVFVSIAQTEQ